MVEDTQKTKSMMKRYEQLGELGNPKQKKTKKM